MTTTTIKEHNMVNTKAELLQEMKRLGACSEATDWVTADEGECADEIWTRCTDVSWLIWFAGRRNPAAIAAFARRCAERAEGYAAATMADYADYAAMAARAANADDATNAADYATNAADYAARAASADYAARAASAAEVDDAERALQLADLHQILPSA